MIRYIFIYFRVLIITGNRHFKIHEYVCNYNCFNMHFCETETKLIAKTNRFESNIFFVFISSLPGYGVSEGVSKNPEIGLHSSYHS